MLSRFEAQLPAHPAAPSQALRNLPAKLIPNHTVGNLPGGSDHHIPGIFLILSPDHVILLIPFQNIPSVLYLHIFRQPVRPQINTEEKVSRKAAPLSLGALLWKEKVIGNLKSRNPVRDHLTSRYNHRRMAHGGPGIDKHILVGIVVEFPRRHIPVYQSLGIFIRNSHPKAVQELYRIKPQAAHLLFQMVPKVRKASVNRPDQLYSLIPTDIFRSGTIRFCM